jgi:hypothetical protein
MPLPNKVILKSVKFHLDKVFELEREYHKRESAGRKKILEAENELKESLSNLQKQIEGHREQAKSLESNQ